jgi:tetratricopeptide (TPR) repeat protein
MRYRATAAISAVTFAVGGYFIWHRGHPGSMPEPTAAYVHPAACTGCHAEIAKTYRLTGMGHSFYRPAPQSMVEDFTTRNRFYHRASDRTYNMLQRDGKFYQQRHFAGFDGKPAGEVEMQADYVIGSGNHARSYLHRSPEGRLIELPVSWYAAGGGYWGMSPGYDRPDHQDFQRPVGFNCLFCHNGYPRGFSGDQPVFRGELPEGIDCQRCHGPGGAHVEAASTGKSTPEAIRRAIVNPARLNRNLQLDICMQCHLEPTSGPLPNMLPRFGRGPFSYRPGQPLGETFLFFDQAPGAGRDDKFEIAHQAYRLRKSRCFLESQMTCSTCHNPHDIPRAQAAQAHYVAACTTCHATPHTPAGCIECHMPKRRTDDAVHVVMTDHYIQRRAPARDLLAALEEPRADQAYRGEVVPYYPPAMDELYLALAQVRDGANLADGIQRLRKAIESRKPEEAEFYLELGKAYARGGNPQDAVRWCEEAYRRRPGFTAAGKELAAALIATGDLSRASAILEKIPPDAVALTNLGNVYLRQGNLGRAASALQQALAIDPDLADTNQLLGTVKARQGDRTAAESFYRKAITTQPAYPEAHRNLANLLAGARDYGQAAYHFEKAIAAAPKDAESHHGYGLLMIVIAKRDKALEHLKEAVRLAPQLAQPHSDLADVLAEQGRTAQAIAEYRLAVQSNPALFEAQLALGILLARAGDRQAARPHLEKASRSPEAAVRQAAAQALR